MGSISHGPPDEGIPLCAAPPCALAMTVPTAEAVRVIIGSDDDHGTSLHRQHCPSSSSISISTWKALPMIRRRSSPISRRASANDHVKSLTRVEVKSGALALVRQTPEINPRMMQRYSDGGLSAPPDVKGVLHVSCVGRDMDGLQAVLTELQKQGSCCSARFAMRRTCRCSSRAPTSTYRCRLASPSGSRPRQTRRAAQRRPEYPSWVRRPASLRRRRGLVSLQTKRSLSGGPP